MLAFVGCNRVLVGAEIFACGVVGCGLRFASMKALHMHQSRYCLLARETDQTESVIGRYSRCHAIDRQTRLACTACIHTRKPSVEWIREEQRKHHTECHREYPCAHAWCTGALSACIERLWLFAKEGPISDRGSVVTYAQQLLERGSALLLCAANEHMVAQFVSAAMDGLCRLASAFKFGPPSSEWMTRGFLTQSALKAHECEAHTTVSNLHEVVRSRTIASLAAQAIGPNWKATCKQPIRYSLNGEPLNQNTRHTHDNAVAGLATLLQSVLQPEAGRQRCNVQGVFVALVIPANRYDDDTDWYVQQLVLIHSSVYVRQTREYSNMVYEMVADLYRLLDACSSMVVHRYLLVSATQTPPIVAQSEWWGATANQRLARQIFKLCVHVHVTFANHLDTAIWGSVWPTVVSMDIVIAVQAALCTTGNRVQINELVCCLSQLWDRIALVDNQVATNSTNTCHPVLTRIGGVLASIADNGCVSLRVLCVLLAELEMGVHQCELYPMFFTFKRIVSSFRTTATPIQIGRTLSMLMRLPEVVSVQHVRRSDLRGRVQFCMLITVCNKITGVDIDVQFLQPGVIAPTKVSVDPPVSTHTTSLERLVLALQRFLEDPD